MRESTYNTDKSLPSYVRAARELHQMLAKMKVHDRLRPERELCMELGISRVTLRRALEYFHKQGFLEVRRGRGTWLVRPVQFVPPTRDSHLIGLVLPALQQPFISRIVHGAEQYASEHGYHIVLAQDHNDPEYQIQQLRRIADSQVSGLAIYPNVNNLQRRKFMGLLRSINDRNFPFVMINRYLPEIASVMSDDFQGTFIAAQYLILKGYRKLGLLALGPEAGPVNADQRRGFLTALQDYGLEPVLEWNVGNENPDIFSQLMIGQSLAAKRAVPLFNGLVCMDDNMAYGAYLALREAGLRVPEDVALVGYGNLNRELYETKGLQLTSIERPAERIGSEVARVLIDAIEREESIYDTHLLLRPRLIPRGSCGEAVSSVSE